MKHYTVDLAETASVKTEFYPSGVIEGNLKFNTCRDIEREKHTTLTLLRPCGLLDY